MADYFRPLLQMGPGRPRGAPRLGGGWAWFDRVEHLRRDGPSETRPLTALPSDLLDKLTVPRAPMAGLSFDRPQIMAIVNVTPDSFSDGGLAAAPSDAIARARHFARHADILDLGAESTRPGAQTVPVTEEISRLRPVLEGLSDLDCPISVDTRKSAVAEMALNAGADLVNDVSGLTHDSAMRPLLARHEAPLCLMHMPSGPETMQNDPQYDNVLLDVFDALARQLAFAEKAGIPRHHIVIDPGIGFGKTLEHNLALLSRISLFHSLGCAVLVGASRKRFIGTLGEAADPTARMPGSIAVALAAVAQGVHILRVHDVAETAQALALAEAVRTGAAPRKRRRAGGESEGKA